MKNTDLAPWRWYLKLWGIKSTVSNQFFSDLFWRWYLEIHGLISATISGAGDANVCLRAEPGLPVRFPCYMGQHRFSLCFVASLSFHVLIGYSNLRDCSLIMGRGPIFWGLHFFGKSPMERPHSFWQVDDGGGHLFGRLTNFSTEFS